ncbi:MAG: ABC transporter substrate-binding protein [Acidobacteriota bacterium]|nr:ABC transporter substrate-binding protein [Acidobacteriota bacterium]
MSKCFKGVFIPCLLSLAFFVSAASSVSSGGALYAKEITDMYGRKVKVPDKITRVYSISPAVTLMLYCIDPDLLIGVPRQVTTEAERRFFRKSYLELPVLGGSSGEGLNLNTELFLKMKPDVLIVWGDDGAYDQKTAANLEKLGIPVVSVASDGVEKYADTFDFLGKLLDRQTRTGALSSYARKALSEVKSTVAGIPAARRVKVYNTRMSGGLNSACDTSLHAELIPLAGGVNPVRCITHGFTGIEIINMEQVLVMNPDVIVTLDATFAQNIYRDERWTGLRAVKSKRVYLAPSLPINWFDGPPSHMGLLGVQWLANRLYPQTYRKDIEKEATAFIKLFFQTDLSREEIRKIIGK